MLKAGARLDRALELLATDSDIGRLRSTAGAIRSSILAGESFADALAHHPALFPPMYVALVRVGEVSGTLEKILQVLANDRSRAEALRRKVADALRYPAFLLFAAICVLVFFLMFVLPQLGAVLHDFGAKIDPVAGAFLRLSEFMNAHKDVIGLAAMTRAGERTSAGASGKVSRGLHFPCGSLAGGPHHRGAASDCHFLPQSRGSPHRWRCPHHRRCGLSPI